jgi:hypothetical protein
MSIVVKKPSDDPYTWLGPGYTVYHFQEDHVASGDLKNHGLVVDGDTAFGAIIIGNGSYYILKQGDQTNHDLRYIYKDMTGTSTIVVAFDISGPATSNDISANANQDGTWMGIVMKNTSSGKLVNFGVRLSPDSQRLGPSLVIREQSGEYGTVSGLLLSPSTTIRTRGPVRIDATETIILKAERVTSIHTNFSFSLDGVSFVPFDTPYTHQFGADDTNRLGFGIDVVDAGGTAGTASGPIGASTHYTDPYTMAIDWVAYK